MGSLPHCVPTSVGNPLLWAKSISSGISPLRVLPRRWDAAIFTAMLGSPHAAWHHLTPDQQPQRPLSQPDGVGTEPPRCGTSFLGVLSKLHRFPDTRLSAACRALGHKDSNSLAAARPPTSPRLLPVLGDTPPKPRCGQAARAGPGAVPQPCRWSREPDAWGGMNRPTGHVCTQGRLVWAGTPQPGQHRACPPSLPWGHVCGAPGLPNPCPALADGQSWAHFSPRPAFLGDQGTMGRVSVLEGTASLSLTHISLPHTLFKRWKIPAGGSRGAGQGILSAVPADMLDGGSIASGKVASRMYITRASLAPAPCHFPRSSPGPAQSPAAQAAPVAVQHAWGRAAGACQPCLCQAAPAWGAVCPQPTAKAQGLPGSR